MRTLKNGRYTVNQFPIGQGGFGVVMKGQDNNLAQTVAIKQNLDPHPGAVRQFRREAQAMAKLDHAGLPTVYDYFEENGTQYMVMELVPGKNLAALSVNDNYGLPMAEVLDYGVQLAEVVKYLHSQGIVHRDIKPQNVLVNNGRTILVDFGLVKTSPGVTTYGAQAATPGYSPPEQYGQGTNEKADVYSLAATLYAIAAGKHPPLFSQGRPDSWDWRPVPDALQKVLYPALQMRPSARPSMSKMLTQLRRLHGHKAATVRGSGRQSARNSGRRSSRLSARQAASRYVSRSLSPSAAARQASRRLSVQLAGGLSSPTPQRKKSEPVVHDYGVSYGWFDEFLDELLSPGALMLVFLMAALSVGVGFVFLSLHLPPELGGVRNTIDPLIWDMLMIVMALMAGWGAYLALRYRKWKWLLLFGVACYLCFSSLSPAGTGGVLPPADRLAVAGVLSVIMATLATITSDSIEGGLFIGFIVGAGMFLAIAYGS